MVIGKKETIYFVLMDDPGELINIDFYLGQKLISSEPIYTPTYRASMLELIDRIKANDFRNEELFKLSPAETIKVLESERDSNQQQYFKHLLQIDESIDQYYIYAFQNSDEIQLIWNCWDKHNCNSQHQLNKVYSVTMYTSELLSSLSKLCQKLESR